MGKSGRVQKLTKRAVDAAHPSKARYIVWDSELAGFGLRVEPTGRKTFVARYRAGGGRTGTLRQALVGATERSPWTRRAEGRRSFSALQPVAATL